MIAEIIAAGSEMLTPFGWAAFAIGKWHLTPAEDMNLACNRKWWPLGRGFDRFYGFLGGDAGQWDPCLAENQKIIGTPDGFYDKEKGGTTLDLRGYVSSLHAADFAKTTIARRLAVDLWRLATGRAEAAALGLQLT